MKKASRGFANGIRLALAVVAISLLASQHAAAVPAALFWSANGTTQGGAGTWNTTTGHFSNLNANPYSTIWNNANVDSAEFGGTAGQVNLSGPIVVNTITTDLLGFNIGNANLAGSTNTITFSGANAGVNTNYAGGTTTISAVFNGTLVKSGAGRLELGNANNPNTVKYVLNGGTLSSASIARVSTNAPTALVQDFFTFNGGGWGINTGNQDTGATRGITIKAGGAFFGSAVTTINTTISSPIVGTEGGALTVTNVGPFVGNAHQSFALLVLNNGTATPNSWDGALTIATGTVREALNNQVPDTAVVNMVAGTQFDLGTSGVSDTVKSVSGVGGTIAVGTGSLTIGDGAGSTFAGVISASTGGKVTKSGSGVWTLTGSSVGFNGEFVMSAGTLGVGGSNIFGNAANTSKVTITGGILSNTNTTGRTIPAPIPVALNGDFTVDDSQFNSSTPGQILFNGPATINSGNRTITVNGTANLGLGGAVGQDVAGRGIIKNGGGILALTAVNTYSGDTKINAGSINLNSTGTLGDGTGNAILNGGTLNETVSRSGAGQIVANPVQVTANSSITSTSTAATPIFEFSGALTGTAGKTLTFQDNAATATQFKPRFSGSFTMDANIDMPTGTGALAATSQLESFNPVSTTQTFTGTISGTGTFNRSVSSGSAGDTVFTGANTFSGGTTLNSGRIGFGSSSTATTGPIGTGGLTVSGSSSAVYASGAARTVSNAVTLNNGTEFTGSNDLEMSGTVSLGNASRTITVTNTAKTILSGVISDTGGTGKIVKQGPGILTLTGKNTYGTVGVVGTTVTAGTLLVNTAGPDSGTGVGDVLVNGGKLGGIGRIGGSVSVTSGDLSPGASINHLDIGGSLSMTGGSFDYEINSTTSTADLTTVAGNLSLATVALSGSDLGSGLLAYGTKFTLINYGGTWNGGIFTGLPNYSTSLVIGANRFYINYSDTTGGSNFGGGTYGGGSGPHYVTITAVPEASTFLTIGLGGIFAFAAVRLGKRMGINVLKA
jgi:fibronectin-binding autotransporter adhesin